MKIKLLSIVLLFCTSTFTQAGIWCTFDKVTSVRTGANKNAICYMSAVKGSQGFTNINICNNSDPELNDRNLSLAMAALMGGKRMQIYAQGISSCDEVTKWFNKIDYLVMLAD